jgi:peptidoglycan/xylan/chitin deacetylase (PgdA/CDA1 family)
MPKKLAVLAYHKVGEPPLGASSTWFYASEATFTAQLSVLHDEGWAALDLPTFIRGLRHPNARPDRSVLLTFDDGYRSMAEMAKDVLQRFGFPGVVFVPTDFIGKTNSFDREVEPEEAICDWSDLRALEEAGIHVESHGASHRKFSALNAAERREELVRSKRVLEAKLGRRVSAFAFPYGDSGTDGESTRRELAEAGYEVAFLYGGGAISCPTDDFFQLPRIAVGPDTDLRTELGAN